MSSLDRPEPVPPAVSDRIDVVKPKFPGKPEGSFFQKHLRPRRHMSNHESKPLDTGSLFPAGCVCFLHT